MYELRQNPRSWSLGVSAYLTVAVTLCVSAKESKKTFRVYWLQSTVSEHIHLSALTFVCFYVLICAGDSCLVRGPPLSFRWFKKCLLSFFGLVPWFSLVCCSILFSAFLETAFLFCLVFFRHEYVIEVVVLRSRVAVNSLFTHHHNGLDGLRRVVQI